MTYKEIISKSTTQKKLLFLLSQKISQGRTPFSKFFQSFHDGETMKNPKLYYYISPYEAMNYYRAYLKSGLTLTQFKKEMTI